VIDVHDSLLVLLVAAGARDLGLGLRTERERRNQSTQSQTGGTA
jgi:hypothetical protein